MLGFFFWGGGASGNMEEMEIGIDKEESDQVYNKLQNRHLLMCT